MITGKCFCGSVKYQIQGKILKSGVCHCHDCQRLTGGLAWPFLFVPQEALLIYGEFKEFAKIGASGEPVHMGFCRTCGSTLFGRPEIWPHIKTVSASTLDDQSYFSIDMHVWTQDAYEGFIFNPDIPQFDRNSI